MTGKVNKINKLFIILISNAFFLHFFECRKLSKYNSKKGDISKNPAAKKTKLKPE